MRSVAVIGSTGQLGSDLVEVLRAKGWNAIPLVHQDIEITDIESVKTALAPLNFDWIINTAAFHKVDECEKDTRRAWQVNAFGQRNVALIANQKGARSVFISSDYVFNGESEVPYRSDDSISPINAYGHSKVGGEIATLAVNQKNIVLRISSVFGTAGSSGKGGNFIETILKKAKAGETISVVDDIKMVPTYTKDASELLLKAINEDFSGVLHGANSGEATWFDFARYVVDRVGIKKEVNPSKTDWTSPLKRPKYSVLDSTRGSFVSKDWRDAVDRYLMEKGHIQ